MKNLPKIGLALLHILIFSFGMKIASAYDFSGIKWNGTFANYYINNTFALSFRTAMQAADSTWG